MISDDPKQKKAFTAEDCITYDKYSGSVWILLNQYGFIRTDASDDIWFWNNWLTADAAVP